MQANAVNPSQKLVILGASYAASWGTPPLPGYTVVNFGVGGEQTSDMLGRFQHDVVEQKPDAVPIWGHINNITDAPPDELEAVKRANQEHYAQMLQRAREAGITVLLATEIPLAAPAGWVDEARAMLLRLRGKQNFTERVNAEVRELNEYLRVVAARDGLQLLDFERVFAPNGGARIPEFAVEDRSHVTEAGYAALTAYAVKELRTGR